MTDVRVALLPLERVTAAGERGCSHASRNPFPPLTDHPCAKIESMQEIRTGNVG